MNKSMVVLLVCAVMSLSSPARSHSDEYFDSAEAPHGGQMRMAGPYHLELVVEEKTILLYVTDHAENKVSTNGGVAKASVKAGKNAALKTVRMEPAGENLFKGTGDSRIPAESGVIVFLKLPGNEAHAARFTPGAKPARKSPATGHGAEGKKDPHAHH